MKSKTLFLYRILLISIAWCASMAVQAQFTHPGGVHSLDDLNRMREKVLAKESPWIDGWNLMIQDNKAQSTYTASPSVTVGGTDGTRQRAQRDATAAYYNILRWYITGDENHAKCAVRILNAWANTVNKVTNEELFQLSIMVMVQAAEITRLYSGWAQEDIAKFKNMCLNYFYPACRNFIGGCGSWSGWDGPANACILYISIFCEDRDKFNDAIEYYKNGAGGGAIMNMVCQPSGQVAEMGRDIPHAEIGPGSSAEFCQTAYNQGIDLFSYADNRLLTGYEYLCKYNLNHPVEWVPYNDCSNVNFYFIATNGSYRLSESPAYELIYNHYVVRKGLQAPYVSAFLKARGISAIGGEYTGYSGLTFTLDAAKSPYKDALPVPPVPTNVQAVAGVTNVTVSWTPPAGDMVNGAIIQRATSKDGAYTTVGTWINNTSTEYTDYTVTGGTTYYYRIAVKNNTGTSEYSSVVTATPRVDDHTLPTGWSMADIGTVATAGTATYGEGSNRSFMMKASGNSFGSSADACGYLCTQLTGDGSFTIRLADTKLSGSEADRVGIIMRESLASGSKMASIGLADKGFRIVWFAPRAYTNDKVSWTKGNSHTWAPTWFRLTRTGNVFKGYQSRDGVAWSEVSSTTINMGATYYAGIYAVAGSSTSGVVTTVYADSVTITGGGINLPATPANITATPLNSSKITLEWEASPEALSYIIRRALSADGTYVTLTDACNTTFFTDSGLTESTTYYYTIEAVNFVGTSASSAPIGVTTPSQTLPSAPKGVRLTPGNRNIVISWNAMDEVASYSVKRASEETGTYTEVGTSTSASYIDKSVSVGTTYYYKVAGINALGEGASSVAQSITLATAVKLQGSIIGTAGSYNDNPSFAKEAAMDGFMSTYFDATEANGVWVGLDLGETTRATLAQVRYAPRSGYAARMLHGRFQVANQPDFSDAITVGSITASPAIGSLTSLTTTCENYHRYMRYVAPDNGWGNVAEVEFWGHTQTVQPPSSLSESLYSAHINAFPNPFKEVITLSFESEAAEVTLFNNQGQKMHSGTYVPNATLNLGHLPAGLYFLEVKATEGVGVIKLIKE